ncbi:hypothetical protein LEP1GSC196_0460 [Leptospira meyeri serovar Semaranga str. Veldrot Semarang 173]|nr:hypothetical protein LEP1GSC196_0460 [Leptospira meyeri serovar Semaranga str. Veldrot Semarang 173]
MSQKLRKWDGFLTPRAHVGSRNLLRNLFSNKRKLAFFWD